MGDFFMRSTQHVITVGLAPVHFPTPAIKDRVRQPEAIYVQGIETNTGKIYIGSSNVVTDNTVGAFILPEGASEAMLPFVDDENLWVVSTVAGQKLMVTYLSERV